MCRCKRLRRLRITLHQRIKRLERRLQIVAGNSTHPDRDLIVGYVAIEALNAWALFSRSYYLSCALGAWTERRGWAAFSVASTDVLGDAIRLHKPTAQPNSSGSWHRRDEPPWHDPNTLMRACKHLRCSVEAQIAAAFSLNQGVFRDLPVFRNFFAHRNGQTSQAAQDIAPRYTLPSHLAPAELLLSVSPGSSSSVIAEWLAEINITAEFLCRG
jgi:hypothetical protein